MYTAIHICMHINIYLFTYTHIYLYIGHTCIQRLSWNKPKHFISLQKSQLKTVKTYSSYDMYFPSKCLKLQLQCDFGKKEGRRKLSHRVFKGGSENTFIHASEFRKHLHSLGCFCLFTCFLMSHFPQASPLWGHGCGMNTKSLLEGVNTQAVGRICQPSLAFEQKYNAKQSKINKQRIPVAYHQAAYLPRNKSYSNTQTFLSGCWPSKCSRGKANTTTQPFYAK